MRPFVTVALVLYVTAISQGQEKKEIGKYQSAVAYSGSLCLVVCDTTNAQCWFSGDMGQSWTKYSLPSGVKAGPVGTFSVSVTKVGDGLETVVCETITGNCWMTGDYGQRWEKAKSPIP